MEECIKGIDINLHKGDAVVATLTVWLELLMPKELMVMWLLLEHYNGLETVYAHFI